MEMRMGMEKEGEIHPLWGGMEVGQDLKSECETFQ